MGLQLMAASEANIQAVIHYPPLVLRLLAPDDRAAFAEAHSAYYNFSRSEMSVLEKLLDRNKKMQAVEEVRLPDPGDRQSYLDIGCSSQLLHLLLSDFKQDGDPPLNFLLGGDASFHDIDVGYGPVRALTLRVVKEIHAAMANLSESELRRRYMSNVSDEPEKLEAADLDGDLIDASVNDEMPESPVDESLDGLLKAIGELRLFLSQTAEQGCGMLVYWP